MKIFYINLDSASDRRSEIERNLGQFAASDHSIHRVSAYDGAFVEENRIGGKLRPNEKACFLSHIKAIEMSLDDPGPSLILEDDAIFGRHTAALVSHFSSEMGDRDLVFTDICVPTALWMIRLFKLRRQVGNTVSLYDLQPLDFAGSTAYLINRQSKIKLLGILKDRERLDIPYDLVLKQIIQRGMLTSSFTFPFITSLSARSSQSQVQASSTNSPNQSWNLFRKLCFLESADFYPDLLEEIEAMSSELRDRDVLAFAALFKALLADELSDVLG